MSDARAILERFRVIAVVGCSRAPGGPTERAKPSHWVPAEMQEAGYRIIPVNPNADELLGERCYPSLADVPEPVEVVNVFRPSEEATQVVREALAIGAKAVWLQEDIRSEEGRRLCAEAGVVYVEDACMAVEREALGIVK